MAVPTSLAPFTPRTVSTNSENPIGVDGPVNLIDVEPAAAQDSGKHRNGGRRAPDDATPCTFTQSDEEQQRPFYRDFEERLGASYTNGQRSTSIINTSTTISVTCHTPTDNSIARKLVGGRFERAHDNIGCRR